MPTENAFTKATLALLALALPACATSPPADVTPASVLLVTVDTLRADHLGAYGYFRDTSPNLDALASEATVFDNVITTMATTLPAHVSLMTSTHPLTHGIKGNFSHMGEKFGGTAGIRTAAEVFTQLGYATAAFVSAAPLKDHTGIQIGFQHFDQPEERERLGETTVDRALAWLADRPAEQPFFLWVHLWDPHAPYTPEAEFDTFEADADLTAFLDAMAIANTRRTIDWHNGYDGEIRYSDAHLGRLLEGVRAGADWAETAVVVTADHGEGLGQHDWRDHGRIHNEQLFIPLIIKWPSDRGIDVSRVETLGTNMDALPTLFAGLGLPVDDALARQFEGLDLLGTDPAARQYVLAERTHRERGWEDGRRYALLGDGWKYLHATDGEDQLYSLTADRTELRDRREAEPATAAAMLELIEVLLAAEQEHAQGELPPERAEQLRALGYIQ